MQQDPRAMPSLSSQQVQKHRESFYKDPDWKPLISQLYIWIHVSLHLLAAQLIIMYTCIQPTYILLFIKFINFRTKVIDKLFCFFVKNCIQYVDFMHKFVCTQLMNETPSDKKNIDYKLKFLPDHANTLLKVKIYEGE